MSGRLGLFPGCKIFFCQGLTGPCFLTLSAFHMVPWSTMPDIVRAGVVEKWEAAENLFSLEDRREEATGVTVVNCWFCGMRYIVV